MRVTRTRLTLPFFKRFQSHLTTTTCEGSWPYWLPYPGAVVKLEATNRVLFADLSALPFHNAQLPNHSSPRRGILRGTGVPRPRHRGILRNASVPRPHRRGVLQNASVPRPRRPCAVITSPNACWTQCLGSTHHAADASHRHELGYALRPRAPCRADGRPYRDSPHAGRDGFYLEQAKDVPLMQALGLGRQGSLAGTRARGGYAQLRLLDESNTQAKPTLKKQACPSANHWSGPLAARQYCQH